VAKRSKARKASVAQSPRVERDLLQRILPKVRVSSSRFKYLIEKSEKKSKKEDKKPEGL